MYVPAGMRMRSFRTNGNAVSAYTASPSRALFVEIACFSNSGTFVPAGITAVLAAWDDSACCTDAGGFVAVIESAAGFDVCAPWPRATPGISNTLLRNRIRTPRAHADYT